MRYILVFLFIFSQLLRSSQIILRDWRGEVELENSRPLFKNMPLYRFDTIRTKSNSRAKIFVDDVLRLNLGDNTKVIIENANSKKVIIKFYGGLVRIEELKPFRYQIKSPTGFVKNEKGLSSYFMTTNMGRTDLLCINGEKHLFELKLKYDGSIPNGFINVRRKGQKVPSFSKASIILGENENVLPPGKFEKIDKKLLRFYYDASKVIVSENEISKETLYAIGSQDTPLPNIDFNSLIKGYEAVGVISLPKEPNYFNPESKEGLNINEIK